MSRTYLKVKIKSLAAEARIIRHEEAKFPRGRRNHQVSEGLRQHRRHDVRNEARWAQLAYGFLRGRPYHVMEAKTYSEPDWTRVAGLATKYGPGKVTYDHMIMWRAADEPALKVAA